MERNEITRLRRSGTLTAEEAARDDDLRRKIMAEFPPAEPATRESGALSDVKAAIQLSPNSVCQICKDAGVAQIVVSSSLGEFLDDSVAQTLSTAALDRAADKTREKRAKHLDG